MNDETQEIVTAPPAVDSSQVRITEVYRMADISFALRTKMRTLSLGPVAWGFWSWTFHNGSCWASLIFDGPENDPDALVGWAAVTKETDILPVIGCFILEAYRKRGLGRKVIVGLLQELMRINVLGKGDAVFNSAHRWTAYKEIIESCGLRSLTWL